MQNAKTITINDHQYDVDKWTNITPKIQSYIGRNIYLQKHHPLSILRQNIVDYFYKSFVSNRGTPQFTVLDNLSPVVTTQQNFDSLLIPKDHVSRRKSDCYYLNETYLLRGHATAHQVNALCSGLDNFLIVGDVYRRDEINSTHFPVFHQMDAVRTLHRDKLFATNPDLKIFETNYSRTEYVDATKQPCHTLEAVKLIEHEFKAVLIGLAQHLFGSDIKYRWVDAYFPFTLPSWELEINYRGKWLEVMGSGIIRNEILDASGVHNSIGWAFGLGLERLAMVLYNIDDIRLFWSTDSGFLTQFDESRTTAQMQYKPISKYNQCYMDLSFWLTDDEYTIDTFPFNDLYELVRECGGDLVEQVRNRWSSSSETTVLIQLYFQVKIIDQYVHPETKRGSLCFRIIYRHMERDLIRDEVNIVHNNIRKRLSEHFSVEHRA